MRFILGVVKGDIKVSNRKKKDIEVDLRAMGFDEMSKHGGKGGSKAPTNEDGDEEGEVRAVRLSRRCSELSAVVGICGSVPQITSNQR